MAIPNRQIGWSTKSNLLWQISKQLENLTKVTYNRNNVIAVSSSLTFPITYTSISLRCNGGNVNTVYTSTTVNNITEVVNLFNTNITTSTWGTFSASGSDVLSLSVNSVTKNTYCPNGTLSLNVFSD